MYHFTSGRDGMHNLELAGPGEEIAIVQLFDRAIDSVVQRAAPTPLFQLSINNDADCKDSVMDNMSPAELIVFMSSATAILNRVIITSPISLI
jgi:hypothetical protein